MTTKLTELQTDTVIVTEAVTLDEHRISNLMDALRTAWRNKGRGRPIRVQYTRGEALLIERSIARSRIEDESSGLASPYQIVRQHTEMSVTPPAVTPLETLCLAAEYLHQQGAPARTLVCASSARLHEWVGADLQLARVFNIRIYEDSEVPDDVRCFLCGSAESDMLYDVEFSVGILKEA